MKISFKSNLTDLTGLTFGRLTVIERAETKYLKNGRIVEFWRCKCDCGKETVQKTRNLIVGVTKTCGCALRNGWMEISGNYWGNLIRGAKARGIFFDVSIKQAWNKIIAQDFKCALSGVEIFFSKAKSKQTASLDRINPNKGYVLDNIFF